MFFQPQAGNLLVRGRLCASVAIKLRMMLTSYEKTDDINQFSRFTAGGLQTIAVIPLRITFPQLSVAFYGGAYSAAKPAR